MTQHTPAEMRSAADKWDDWARLWNKNPPHVQLAHEAHLTASMLRQAANAMQAIREHIKAADDCVRGNDDVAAMLKFAETDQKLRKIAAMPTKD